MTKRKVLLLVFAVFAVTTINAANFGRISGALGEKSFAWELYLGAWANSIGANFEWGLGSLPVTLGLGLAPGMINLFALSAGSLDKFLFSALGEYALRAGYHPDLGIKGLDVYLNITFGICSVFFLPMFRALQFGTHLGVRYFFGDSGFGLFAEGGWSLNANYGKLGIAFRRRPS